MLGMSSLLFGVLVILAGFAPMAWMSRCGQRGHRR